MRRELDRLRSVISDQSSQLEESLRQMNAMRSAAGNIMALKDGREESLPPAEEKPKKTKSVAQSMTEKEDQVT